jgi:hypothetical protein
VIDELIGHQASGQAGQHQASAIGARVMAAVEERLVIALATAVAALDQQSQITTARLEPLLSLAVPHSMPRTCPNPSSLTPTSRTAGAHANIQEHHRSTG